MLHAQQPQVSPRSAAARREEAAAAPTSGESAPATNPLGPGPGATGDKAAAIMSHWADDGAPKPRAKNSPLSGAERPPGAAQQEPAKQPASAAPQGGKAAEPTPTAQQEPAKQPASAAPQGGKAAEPTPTAQQDAKAAAPEAQNAPSAVALIPFDRNPVAAPGERIIFNSTLSDSHAGDYQLVYKAQGGEFGAPGGATNKTIAGLSSGNLDFHVKKDWDGKSAVEVEMQVQKVADKSVVNTYTWKFSKKTYFPTEMKQSETEGERTLPSAYTYKIGPDRGKDGKDDYVGHTILERFEANQGNITPAELKPEYATKHGLTTQAAVTAHFFGSDAGQNGTFTVFAGDEIYDQHGGGMPDKATFEGALQTMKEVHVDLPQVYEAEPGKALGKYNIRRILKADGSRVLKKSKTK